MSVDKWLFGGVRVRIVRDFDVISAFLIIILVKKFKFWDLNGKICMAYISGIEVAT